MSRKGRFRRVCLAYSGGLDTSVILRWLIEEYGCEVAAVLPHSDEMMGLASSDVFVLRHPGHPITAALRQVASTLVA